MKKRIGRLVALLCCMGSILLSMSACSSGVSQEEYDKVTAELSALKEQYGISDTAESPDETQEQMTAQTDTASAFDEQKVLSQLQVSEYSYGTVGGREWAFLVIENTSEYDLNIDVEFKTYDDAGTLLGVKNETQEAVEHGTKTVMSFLMDEAFAKTEYTMSLSEEDSWECVISDLSFESTPAKNKEIVSVTNHGQEAAEFVKAYVLFFNGQTLVSHANAYFIGDDALLKPGETISKEMDCYEPYDSYQIYLMGRR